MDSLKSPSGSTRRYGRNISHPTRQRATRGPLENAGEDPLADSPTSPSGASLSETTQSVQSTDPEPVFTSEIESNVALARHLVFLSHPDAYSQLSANDIPKAFLDAGKQPSTNSELPELLRSGHFRFAAEKAAQDLLSSKNDSAEHILQLLYVRLACLVLISRPDLAAHEAVPMIEFLARNSPGAPDVLPLVPWDLRLLLVRLQAVGASDGGRRGVMALYGLASEVRSQLRVARKNESDVEVGTWSGRLDDLGLRVCDALVEMGELETAARHLETLHNTDEDELAYRKALLRIRVGDISGAGQCADRLTNDMWKQTIKAVIDIADGDFSAESWQSLIDAYPSHELFAQNAAVSLLYTGHIVSARELLEDLTERLPMFPTLLFNLSTIYELCSERAVEDKTALAAKAAFKNPAPDSGGWERGNYEFKL